MTLVIAHKSGWMLADRRVTFGNEIGPLINKILRLDCGGPALNKRVLVGSAGQMSITRVVRKVLNMQDTDCHNALGRLCDAVADQKEPTGQLIVLLKPPAEVVSLWTIDSAGCEFEYPDQLTAIGSAEDLARGYLGNVQGTVTMQMGIKALRFASERDVSVSPEYQLEVL